MARTRDTIFTRLAFTGDDQMKRQLNDLGAAGEKALKDLGDASKTSAQDLALLSKTSQDLQNILGRIGGGASLAALSNIGTAARGMNTALGVTLGIVLALSVGLVALAKSAADAASEIKEGATRVGVTAQDYSRLKFAFEQSGAGAEAFEGAMGRILEAADSGGNAAEDTSKIVEAANSRVTESAKRSAEALAQFNEKVVDGNTSTARAIEDAEIERSRALKNITGKNAEDIAAKREEIAKGHAERIEAIDLASARRREDVQKALTDQMAANFKKAREQIVKDNEEIAKSADTAARGAKNKFQEFGISVTDAAGRARDPVKVFGEIAEKLSDIDDGASRSAKAIELFGRRIGTKLVEALENGKQGLEELGREAERLGLVFTDTEIAIGKKFSDTLGKLGDTVKATTSKVGLEFARIFDVIVDSLAKALGNSQQSILRAVRSVTEPIAADIENLFAGNRDKVRSQFILVFGDVVKILADGFGSISKAIAAFVSAMLTAFDLVANAINAVFGTKLVAGDIPAFIAAIYLAQKAVLALGFAFGLLAQTPVLRALILIGAAVALLTPIIEKNWPVIQKFLADLAIGFNDVATTIEQRYSSIATFFSTTFQSIANTISSFFTNIASFLDQQWQTIRAGFTSLVSFFSEQVNSIIGFFQNLINKARELTSALAGAFGGAGGEAVPGFAHGTIVGGRGRGDTVPAMLEPGEAVTRRAAVALYGRDFFRALNRMALPVHAVRRAMRGAQGFNRGGFAAALSSPIRGPMHFAGGGLVPALAAAAGGGGDRSAPVIINLDGRRSTLWTDRETSEALARDARRTQTSSAGRSPSWNR